MNDLAETFGFILIMLMLVAVLALAKGGWI